MKLFVTWWTQQKRVGTHLSSYIKQEFALLQFKVLVPALFSRFYLWTFQQLLGRLLTVNVGPRCIIVRKGGTEICKPWQTRPHEWTGGAANTSCVLLSQQGLTVVPPLFLILRHNIKLRFFCWIAIDASIHHHIGIWPESFPILRLSWGLVCHWVHRASGSSLSSLTLKQHGIKTKNLGSCLSGAVAGFQQQCKI